MDIDNYWILDMTYLFTVTFFSIAFTFLYFFRFFCNDAIMFDSTTKKDDGDLTQDAEQDCQKQEVKHVAENVSQFSETEKSARTIFTPPGETQKNCFRWFSSLIRNSGNPGPSCTVFSQQFHQQRSNCAVSQDQMNGVQTGSGAACGELEKESSPLTELEQSSQSQSSCELSECNLESSELPHISNNSSDAEVRILPMVSVFTFTLHYRRNQAAKSSLQNDTL